MVLVVFVFAQNSGEFELLNGPMAGDFSRKAPTREKKTMYPKVPHLFVITTRNISRSHSLRTLFPGFLQHHRQPFDFFPLRGIVDVLQSGLLQFFLCLFARVVERAAENFALRLESKVFVFIGIEDVSDGCVDLDDIARRVDDVGNPRGAVGGGNVAGDWISSAYRAKKKRPLRAKDPFSFKDSRGGGVVARNCTVYESKLRSRAFQWREFVQAGAVEFASFSFSFGFFRVGVEVLIV